MVVINALIPVFGLDLARLPAGWRRWVPTQAGDSLSSVTFKLFMPVAAVLWSGKAEFWGRRCRQLLSAASILCPR